MSNGEEYPRTHNELFKAFIQSRRTVIHEYSGDILDDYRALMKWAGQYATDHGLECQMEDE